MKMMDVSIDDDDCAVEAVKPAKKKKMKQAQLPFQALNSAKLSPSTNIEPNKKRKVTSPLVSLKSPKVSKLSKKDHLNQNILEDEEENVRGSSKECIVVSDDEKKDVQSEQSVDDEKKDVQSKQSVDDENKKGDITPKRSSLGKNKKLDKSQQKSGALTKFLKKTDRKITADSDGSTRESKSRQDLQDTSVQEEKNEVSLDESLEPQSSDKYKLQMSQGKESPSVHNDKQAESPSFQQWDSDVAVLSSDNENPSELDGSTLSRNEETEESAVPVTPKSDKHVMKTLKRLTPKQLEKREEIARRKEEKLKLRKEKEKKREEEKANRRRERQEKQKEKEEKERMEKEQKKKEKELKELKKQLEIEQKQKDKEAKEEERRKREEAREEEKRRKEEEKLEAERRKQKAASNFASFFVSRKHEAKQIEEESVVEVKNFMPFEVKADMKIAPVCRRMLNEGEKSLLDEQRDTDVQKSKLYVEDLRKGRIVPRTSLKTWPLEAKDDDIILLDDDNDGSSNIIRDAHNLEKHRPKLLQFKENRRPPYWGTWRKRSKVLNSRRPFVKDEKWFDYEVDSDDEWEEEEPGESLKGSDDEKDEENPEENEYDVDNEFMVPHGYLSDEEARADEEEMEDMSPHTQKMKLKILGEQFEAEMNAKTHKLKPKIIGCCWEGIDKSFPESVPPHIRELLSARRAWVRCVPITLPSSTTTEDDSSANAECKTPTQSTRGPKKTKFPNEALADLIRLLHGNTHGRHFLMREFMTFWNRKDDGTLSKVSVLQKINEVAKRIACPEKGPMHLKSCWYVSSDIRKQCLPDDEELSLPNRWTYILTPSRKSNTQDVADKPEKEEREKEKEKERKHVPLITQFAKKITQEEMKRQLTRPEGEETSKQPTQKLLSQVTSKLPSLQRPPKRATLISVGRGEQFPEKSRILAISINKKQEEEASTSKEKSDDDNDIVFVESASDTSGAKSQKPEASDEQANCDEDMKPSKGGNAGANVIVIDDFVE
ncbi:hypothetical protein DMN91_009404 [Ooceraea biroi]|uniref:Chromatin assembly factor 1 subunit A n=1 Tax=Ooceraea biroi TaxID=2015173 RepID=A0A3L8DFG5_OOCBI|nr:chromatin assembly factor 1 subunit A [Ooceraea biroi]RLU19046.1 hypothetical protein DMN91_009404 [Ooceraea biroi]